MWTWVLSLATVAGLVVVSTLYIFRPEVLYTANFAFHSARARLRRGQHTIIAPAGEAREDADAAAKAQEFSFSFLQRNAHEKGARPTILLLHGFTSEGVHWAEFIAQLSVDNHLIALDLPGHGQSSRDPSMEHTIPRMVELVRHFVVQAELERLHVVGLSLGGAIATGLAALEPKRVVSLSLLCPAGIEAPTKSKFVQMLEQPEPKNVLTPTNHEEFQQMLDLAFASEPFIPKRIRDYIIGRMQQDEEFFNNMLRDLAHEDFRFWPETMLSHIQAPTLVVWGDSDHILDISAASKVTKAIPDAELVVVENCGHALPYEKPALTATFVSRFLDTQNQLIEVKALSDEQIRSLDPKSHHVREIPVSAEQSSCS